jgi:hypothetical protein
VFRIMGRYLRTLSAEKKGFIRVRSRLCLSPVLY